MPGAKHRIEVPVVAAREVLAAEGRVTVIDLRSPGEFAEDHLPGAVNVPLFDDVERAVVGTLYRRESPESAFREARERTIEKIEQLVSGIAEVAAWTPPRTDLRAKVAEMTQDGMRGMEGGLELAPRTELEAGAVVLSCWRGGLRSRSVVALLGELGLERALALEGGYRAYRAHVRAELAELTAPARTFVLRGLTGVGKTLVLRAVEELRPGWTVDLEGIAGHRSSILGMVGLAPVTQKAFESGLAARLRARTAGRPCVFEGESRKVGDVILPERVWGALVGGESLELVASTARRVDVLIEDYLAKDESRAELTRQLPFIEERLGKKKWAGVLVGLLAEERDRELVELLLEHYYDPLYRHSEGKHAYATRIDAESAEDAARDVVAWIEARQPL